MAVHILFTITKQSPETIVFKKWVVYYIKLSILVSFVHIHIQIPQRSNAVTVAAKVVSCASPNNETPSQNHFSFRSFMSFSDCLCAVNSDRSSVHAPVVLNGAGLDGLPHLLVVPWLLLLRGNAGCLEAGLGSWCGRARAGRSGGGDHALRVEDGVGLVHLLVVLLESLPRLGDVAVGLLLRRHGGGGVLAGGSWGAGGGGAERVGCLVGGVERVVVSLGVSRDVGEDVGWHFGSCGCVCCSVCVDRVVVVRSSRID